MRKSRRNRKRRDAFLTRRFRVAGIHRALINFRDESKASLIGGVMTSFLITLHGDIRERSAWTNPFPLPSDYTDPRSLSFPRSLVAGPLSLLTLTRALNNRVVFHLSLLWGYCRPVAVLMSEKLSRRGRKSGRRERNSESGTEKKSVRSPRCSFESMQARQERDRCEEQKRKVLRF